MAQPRILWDCGTAYDLFVSLVVLHYPEDFRVPASWTASVRARLPAAERDMLERSLLIGPVPLHWIHSLPDPKDGATVLWSLNQVPAADRLPLLALAPDKPPQHLQALLREVSARGAWDEKDLDLLHPDYRHLEEGGPLSADELAIVLDWWAHPAEFGERFLRALRVYHEVFFAEEERRIRPALQVELARAQELAANLALPELLEELSQGLRFDEPPQVLEVVLAPSYWSTPLVTFGKATVSREIWLFGARPPSASLVPGLAVPDALLRALQALADPTRLRILRYLSEEPLAPAELSRRLRLRAPTVTHHLKALRLAGLVQLTIGMGTSKDTKYYAARAAAVQAAFSALQDFLAKDSDETPDLA